MTPSAVGKLVERWRSSEWAYAHLGPDSNKPIEDICADELEAALRQERQAGVSAEQKHAAFLNWWKDQAYRTSYPVSIMGAYEAAWNGALLATAPPEQALVKCARCLEMKETVLVETGFAGEHEPLCGQCISKERADQPQATSGGALTAREWLIEWNKKRMLHPSQDACVESLANLLAAHDKKVRAEVLEEAAKLLDRWLNEKWIGAPADVIRSLASGAVENA